MKNVLVMKKEFNKKLLEMENQKIMELIKRIKKEEISYDEIKEELMRFSGSTPEFINFMEKLIERVDKEKINTVMTSELRKEFALRLAFFVRNKINDVFMDLETKLYESIRMLQSLGNIKNKNVLEGIAGVLHRTQEYFEHETREYYDEI